MGVRWHIPVLTAAVLGFVAGVVGQDAQSAPPVPTWSWATQCPAGLIACGTSCCAEQPKTISASDCVNGWCIPADNPPSIFDTTTTTIVTTLVTATVDPLHPSLPVTPLVPIPVSPTLTPGAPIEPPNTGTGTGTSTAGANHTQTYTHTHVPTSTEDAQATGSDAESASTTHTGGAKPSGGAGAVVIPGGMVVGGVIVGLVGL